MLYFISIAVQYLDFIQDSVLKDNYQNLLIIIPYYNNFTFTDIFPSAS